MTGLKLPFWGLSFVEFWCWGLIFGGQGGPGPQGLPPGSAPEQQQHSVPYDLSLPSFTTSVRFGTARRPARSNVLARAKAVGTPGETEITQS